MQNKTIGWIAAMVLTLALMGGCGWVPLNLATGDVGIDVGYATAPGCKNVWVTVKQIWVHTSPYAEVADAGWQKLDFSTAPLTINLSDPAASTDGGGTGVTTLISKLSVPAGDYYQVRVFLAATEDPVAPDSPAGKKGLKYYNQVDDIDPATGSVTSRPLRIPAAGQGIRIVRDAKSPITVQGGSYARYSISFNLARDLVKTDREGTGNYEYLLKPQPIIINMGSVGGIRGSIKTFANMSGFNFVIKAVQAGGEVMSCTPTGIDANGNLAFSLYPLPATKDTYNVVIQGRKTDTYLIEHVPVQPWPSAPFARINPVPVINGNEYPINFSLSPTGASLSFSRTSTFGSLGPSCTECHTGQVSVTETYHLDPFTGRFATPLYLSSNPPHVKTFDEADFHYFPHADNNGTYKVVANALFHKPSVGIDITSANAGQTLTTIPSLTTDGATAGVSGRIILGQGAPGTMDRGQVLISYGGMVIDRADASPAIGGTGAYAPFMVPVGGLSSSYGLYAFGWSSTGSATVRATGSSAVDLRSVTGNYTSADITMVQLP